MARISSRLCWGCLLVSCAVAGNVGPAFISSLPGRAQLMPSGRRCQLQNVAERVVHSGLRVGGRNPRRAVMQAGAAATPDEDGWYDTEKWDAMKKSPARQMDPVGELSSRNCPPLRL